ncbi:MAG: endonuclease III domain-containing protein [Thermoplasmata archaeon]
MLCKGDFILDEIEKMVPPHRGIWDDPFRILVTAIMSTRTKDEVTDRASLRLFCRFPTAGDLAGARVEEVRNLIKPVGFYRAKAASIVNAAKIIMEKYGGNVPERMGDLLEIPGVGRKVAGIVLSYGLGKDAIAVDTHVQRISFRLGLSRSRVPEKTEAALKRKIRRERWNEVNSYFVSFGKRICRPLRPRCDVCSLRHVCRYWREHEGSS